MRLNRTRGGLLGTCCAVVAAGVLAAAGSSRAQVNGPVGSGDVEMSPISGPSSEPRRHARVQEAGTLSLDDAARLYGILAPSLRLGYGASGDPAGSAYQDWARANSKPYRSAAHGATYVNNYVNAAGGAYLRYEQAGTLPVGTVIAKDSFSVVEGGDIVLGSLFVMEKMPSGFNFVSGDWKYSQIRADGTLLGETRGPGAERVEYCIACHLAREEQDHLFFVPQEVRGVVR